MDEPAVFAASHNGTSTGPGLSADRPEPGPLLMGLGFAILIGERLNPQAPTSRSLAVLVGLARRAAARGRQAVALANDSPTLVMADAVAWSVDFPAKAVAQSPIVHTRRALSSAATSAEASGQAAISEGRAQALAALHQAVNDASAWAQLTVVPKVVDGMVPHLVSTVVPQLIDEAMPQIRTRVVPLIIEDLTSDPRFRKMLRENTREVVAETVEQLRTKSDG
jgi:hypothetical protein